MKKIIQLLTAILFFSTLNAQKKFFSSHEFVAFARFDNNVYSNEEWQSVFAPGKRPQSNGLDTLDNTSFGNVDVTAINPGLRVTFQKILPVFKPVSKTRIEWNLGGGFHVFEQGSPIYSSMPKEFTDTTKVYNVETESFKERQLNLDLYTSFTCITGGKKLNLYFGAGFEYSFPIIQHQIKESYRHTVFKYNWPARQWEEKFIRSSENTTESVSVKILSLTVPVGVLFKISNHYQLKAGAEYLYSIRYPKALSPSHGILAQIGIRYNWF